MAKTKEIQRRLKSINNIKKITKAMEMVAAAKMRRAIEAVLRTRDYAHLSWETALNLATISESKREPLHPLLASRPVINRVAIIVMTSNRGLCGGFNANLLNKVRQSIKKYHFSDGALTTTPEFILVGKKAESLINLGYKIAADFPKSDSLHSFEEVHPLSQLVINDFLSGHYDKVLVAYTDFINPIKQVPRIKQLLPISLTNQEDQFNTNHITSLVDDHLASELIFEPSRQVVMDKVLPKLIEVQIFQAMLEVNASEHSARMSAMRQASDAASDMVEELTLFFNKARQASITAEIAEISAGASALIDN